MTRPRVCLDDSPENVWVTHNKSMLRSLVQEHVLDDSSKRFFLDDSSKRFFLDDSSKDMF